MPKNILIIEDNLHLRESLQEILELEGYAVLVASNGVEGLERACKDLPQLILCDLKIPLLDGFAVIEALRARAETAHIPVLILAGLVDPESIRRGLELGAADYVTKPFSPPLLLQRIRQRLAELHE